MTATALAPTAPPPVAYRRALGWLASAGTLPYVLLKILWLAGSPVGTRDPAFLADPVIHTMNAVTLGMDLVVVALALALTHRWGARLPAWLVLLPMWVGTGFLVPMAVAIAPATVVTIATGAIGTGPLQPWVQPMVYGGFAWQGIFLCAAFVVHTRGRWGGVLTATAPPAQLPLLRVIAGGGTAMAGISAVLQLAVGLAGGDVIGLLVQIINAALAASGAAGVLALVRGALPRPWIAAAAAWTGTAGMFSWGLYNTAIMALHTPLAAGSAAHGLAQLTGLLGGFALAVAGLLALTGPRVAKAAH
jgi:hypothetical protein